MPAGYLINQKTPVTHTIEDLGNAVKKKYPGVYDDLDSAKLGRAVQRKYPGVYDDAIDPENPPGPNFIQSLATPFVKVGGSIARAATGIADLGKAGVQYLSGNKAGAQSTIQEANKNIGQPIDMGGGYKVPVGGFDLQGNKLSTGQTVKNAIGTGADIGSYLIGGEGVGAVGEQGLKGAVLQGAKQGAKYGAVAGGLQGFGSSMEDPNSGVGDVVGSTIEGGIGGGVFGGVVGAAGAGITNRIANRGQIAVDKIASEVSDPLDKNAKINLFKQTGKTTAAGQELGVKQSPILRRYLAANNAQDLARAQAVQEFVQPGKTLGNIARLNQGIEDISQNVIRPNLEANPRAFNLKTLASHLKSEPLPISIQSDATLNKAYDLVQQKMLDIADKHPKTMAGLWEARQEFDQLASKEFGQLAFQDPKRVAIRSAVLNVRRSVNNFIGSQVGDDVFANAMKKLSFMFDARDNIAERNFGKLNTNAVKRLFVKYPNTFKVLGILGGGEIIRRSKILENL